MSGGPYAGCTLAGSTGRRLALDQTTRTRQAAFLPVWLWSQRRAADPIVPLSLFSRPVYAAASVIGMVTGVALYAAVVFMPARHILDNKERLECNWDNGRVYLDKTEVVYELGQVIEVKLSEAVEETRSLIAKPAVELVPGPAPEAPVADSAVTENTVAESTETPAETAPKVE